jgi:hypothetical protein
VKVKIEGSFLPNTLTRAITAGGIGSKTHWHQVIVCPVSNARNIWPPDRLPELPKENAALILGVRLFLGSTFSAT